MDTHLLTTDLSRWTDPVLLAILSGEHGQAASHELFRRHGGWIRALLARGARRRSLQPADIEDAQQQAYFAWHEALRRFDPARGCRCPAPNGDHAAEMARAFRKFAARVVTDRFRDFLRHRRRQQGRFRLDPMADPSGPHGWGADGEPEPSRCEEPWEILARREESDRIAAAVTDLADRDRATWELLACGWPLREAARELGIPAVQAQKRREHLLRGLASRLAATDSR